MSLEKLELIRNKVAIAGTKRDLTKYAQGGLLCVPSPVEGPWAGCPPIGYFADPSYAYGFFEDFLGLAIDDTTALPVGWTATADTTGAIILELSSPGGTIKLTTHTDANDAAGLILGSGATGEPFLIKQNTGKKLWYGSRVKMAEHTDNLCAFIGLAGGGATFDAMTDTTGILADNVDLIGFNVLAASGDLVKYSFKTGTKAVVAATAITAHAAAYYTYNLYFDGLTTVYVYINDVYIGTMDVSAAAFPENGVAPAFFVKTTSGAKNMHIDWVKCVQLR